MYLYQRQCFQKMLTCGKYLSVAMLLVLLSGCSTIFTRATELEPGVFRVTARGNVFNSQEGLLKKVESKAGKLCPENGYDFQGESVFNTQTQKSYVNGGMMDVTSTQFVQVVVCR